MDIECGNPVNQCPIRPEAEGETSGYTQSLSALLGSVVYVATDAYSNCPQLEYLPAVLTSIDNTLEKHCELSQICDPSHEHDHDSCRVYVDKDLVRAGGSLVSDEELAARKLIIKIGDRDTHYKVKPILMTEKGISLVDASSITGIQTPKIILSSPISSPSSTCIATHSQPYFKPKFWSMYHISSVSRIVSHRRNS